VLVEGSTFVILADVYGAAGPNADQYIPEQEWQSTDGGDTWSSVDTGFSVSDGIINADTGPLSAVTVPGTGVLGYGWETAGGPPTFNAFPLSSPPVCSAVDPPAPCPGGAYATLEPSSNPDQIGNGGGQFASQLGANPGVLGVFFTDNTNGPFGCSDAITVPFGFAYAYASGAQSATNNYNTSPGSPGSAWRLAATLGDCNVEYQAVGGGPSGFGVLEDNELKGQTVYHRFDQTTDSFDTPLVTVDSQGELDPALSQDGSGGIYATYLAGGDGGPLELSYSADGGTSWTGNALNADKDGRIGDASSSVNAAGHGWAAWNDNGSVFAQSFQAVDAVAPAVVNKGATSNGSTVTLKVSCTAFPCKVSITLTAPETVVVHVATARAARKQKTKKEHKTIRLGAGTFTIKTEGAKKLSLKLSGTGKKFVRAHKGRIKVTAEIKETVADHIRVITQTLTLTIKTESHKK